MIKPGSLKRLLLLPSIAFILTVFVLYLNLNTTPPICHPLDFYKQKGSFMDDLPSKRELIKFVLTPWKVEKTITNGICGYKPTEVRWSMVIVVKSSAGHFDRRDVIRDTWGGIRAIDQVIIELVFVIDTTKDDVINKKVDGESFLHGDILLMPYTDTTSPITMKTLAGMQWASHILPDRWFYSSADDDIALNMPDLVSFLDSLLPHYRVQSRHNKFDWFGDLPIVCVYSYQDCDIPARSLESKWMVPHSKYGVEQWPVYCRGGFYTTTSKMAARLFDVSRSTELLALDDVWITGLLRSKLKMGNSNIIPAPFSQLTNAELVKPSKEIHEKLIVRHMWGDIPEVKQNVVSDIRKSAEEWKSKLELQDVCAP
uniref:Hexosyltransferase n=1 Tax=Ciona savignyi TaxID=51511 RepID=H2Z2A9_CIOSA